MLHYKDRHNKIHILTMDRVILEDIDQRLAEYPGLESVERVKPCNNGSAIQPQDLLKKARDTTTSRLLIIDVRSQTLPQLQRAYSDIVRFNRPDFNRYCYAVLVGDGPRDFLHPDRGKKALPAYIADLRANFSAAAFFGDPFLYYSPDEIQHMAVTDRNFLPEKVSQRFEPYFKGDRPTHEKLRRYFRAVDKQGGEKLKERRNRRKVLKRLFVKFVLDAFPEDGELIRQALSGEGLEIPGETLRFNIYPFGFEKRVLKLFQKAQAAS